MSRVSSGLLLSSLKRPQPVERFLRCNMPDPDDLAALRRELDAEEKSFMLNLRTAYEWDKELFEHLINAMVSCYEADKDNARVERWVAAAFWYIPQSVAWIVRNPMFVKHLPNEYYVEALRQLDDLAVKYFMGESGPS
jgi:hypothetical protein